MLWGRHRRQRHRDCTTWGMNPYFFKCLAAAGFAVAVAGGSAHAAADRQDKSERAAEQAEKKPEKTQKREAPSRFDSCKRDARGKQGPDRATFMTECLHERH